MDRLALAQASVFPSQALVPVLAPPKDSSYSGQSSMATIFRCICSCSIDNFPGSHGSFWPIEGGKQVSSRMEQRSRACTERPKASLARCKSMCCRCRCHSSNLYPSCISAPMDRWDCTPSRSRPGCSCTRTHRCRACNSRACRSTCSPGNTIVLHSGGAYVPKRTLFEIMPACVP